MKITSTKRRVSFTQKAVTSYEEKTSSNTVETIQQEHIEIIKKEIPHNEKDADSDILPFLITKLGSVSVGAGTYKISNIPRNITQVELAGRLEAIGAESAKAEVFSKHIIGQISHPTVRNVIISIGTGLTVFTFIYKSNLSLWLKIFLSLAITGGMLYLTFTYLPNPTKPKIDNPAQQDTVIENGSN